MSRLWSTQDAARSHTYLLDLESLLAVLAVCFALALGHGGGRSLIDFHISHFYVSRWS